MKKKLIDQVKSKTHTRNFSLDHKGIDPDARTVPISISSETPAQQFFGTEVLKHTRDAIDMSHAGMENGLPLLVNHDLNQLIGRVRGIKLKNKRLIGTAHFSKNTKLARSVWADVVDGFRSDISVQYDIVDIDPSRADRVSVTRWKPFEVSVQTVPADISVGINRSNKTVGNTAGQTNEDSEMDEENTGGNDESTVTKFTEAQKRAHKDGTATGAKLERERVSAINTAFGMHANRAGVNDLAGQCIADGVTASRASEMLLEYLAGDPTPTGAPAPQAEGNHGSRAHIVADESDKWVEGITESLMVRGGLVTDREARRKARQSEFTGMSLETVARDYLQRQRASVSGMNRQQIAGAAFTRDGMHGTSDFANVLENIANKALLMGYDEAPETWNVWCGIGSLSDFKIASRVNLSSFSDLELVLESDEYKEGHLSDLKETIQLGKYGRLFSLSRESILNDDVDAFSKIPRSMGMAANRTVGDLAYGVLTANAALNQDATTLFHANHGNLGTGGVITETTLDEFGTLMAAQTSPAPGTGETGAVLNVRPKFLLIPRAIQMAALKVTQTPTNPSGTAGALDINTQANQWQVVSDARLDADSVTQYYAAADPNIVDTVEVAFLDGDDSPYMESKNGFTQDGVTYKVRIEAAAAALDFRGLARNAGA